MTEPITKVVFRVWKSGHGKGETIALFPHIEADHAGNCLCYERVGQHGAADYSGCIRATRPATSEEATPLKSELERLGYRLEVIQRKQ